MPSSGASKNLRGWGLPVEKRVPWFSHPKSKSRLKATSRNPESVPLVPPPRVSYCMRRPVLKQPRAEMQRTSIDSCSSSFSSPASSSYSSASSSGYSSFHSSSSQEHTEQQIGNNSKPQALHTFIVRPPPDNPPPLMNKLSHTPERIRKDFPAPCSQG
jgi:hypothetical protein